MQDNTSIKAKMINLINSVRTLMRSMAPLRTLLLRQLTSNLVPLIFLNMLIIVWAIAFG
jgi:immediate early response 3-interacting protein 1